MARSIADLPGPSRLLVVGNAHQLVRINSLHLKVEEWCERYGPIFQFRAGPRHFVVIGDGEEINRVLRDRPEGFRRWREMQRAFEDMGIFGVFPAEGNDWRRQRRLAVTALNANHLRSYFHVLRTVTERLDRRLTQAAHDGHTLDIRQDLSSFATDVTSALTFGHDLNTLERGENGLHEHIQRVLQMVARRTAAPVPHWRWVRLPADRALGRSLAVLHRAVAVFIEQARERMTSRPELHEKPENLLEAMLAAGENEGSFSDEEIIGNTLGFLIGGEATTANTLAWTIWFLASRPEVQARWAREADEVLGEQRLPSGYEAVEELRYGEAVVRESIRLKSVVPIIGAELLADATIAGTHMPVGTQLLLLSRYAGLQSVAGGSEFHPERWLENGDETDSTPDQKTFLAFGAGPRFCPGRNLAFLESKTVMAMLVRNFEIELDTSTGPVKELFNFTVIPNGLRVQLHERAPRHAIQAISA